MDVAVSLGSFGGSSTNPAGTGGAGGRVVWLDPLLAPVTPELATAVLDHRGAEELDEGVGAAAGAAAGLLGRKSANTTLEADDALPPLGWPSIPPCQH